MIDNESFLDFFKGLYVSTIKYYFISKPYRDKSRFSVYYHEVGVDTAVSLDFELGGSAARINIFNDKDSEFLIEEEKAYLQSMAGHKVKLEFLNIDYLNNILSGKAINNVSIDFECIEDPNYPPHEKIYLVRENKDGEVDLAKDFTIEGDQHFGGKLNNTTYRFNITRYFVQLLNNEEYTDVLYLLSSGGSAMRTELF